MFDKLFSFIAPHSCCGCQKTGTILCEHCAENIISEPVVTCLSCEKPAVAALCRMCLPRSPWMAVWAVGAREGVLKLLIDLYKFERVMAADDVLAALLVARLPDLPADAVCTYVPASAAHRRQRGYDHMQRIARRVAQKKSVQYAPLLDRRHDADQRGHTRAERLHRQDGAFVAQPRAVSGPIVLIDDIYTTGGTLRAATKALREVYDQPIYTAVIARQPSHR